MRQHLDIFVGVGETGDDDADLPAESAPTAINENLDKSVEELELSVRSYNCLKNANIRIGDDLGLGDGWKSKSEAKEDG